MNEELNRKTLSSHSLTKSEIYQLAAKGELSRTDMFYGGIVLWVSHDLHSHYEYLIQLSSVYGNEGADAERGAAKPPVS